ncbi:MAG: DUF3105 domain-containing protein [Nocardioides sp.]
MTEQPLAEPSPVVLARRWWPLVVAGVLATLSIGTGAALALVIEEERPADLSEVVVYEDLPVTHVRDPYPYAQSPPAGGPHFEVWLECGVYDSAVPDEMAVHDLEHGTFWFAYDPEELSDDEVDELAGALPGNGIMAPYPGLASPVVVTVWERQLALDGADDPRLPLFIDEFAGGTTAPEPMASCAGGVTEDELRGVQPS